MRVFVSLGTHPQQFNRLLKAIDKTIERGQIKGIVFAQTGNSDYPPRHFSFEKFLAPTEFSAEFSKADVIISHGGAGAIIHALQFKKPLIIVPRLKKFGEHTDDHQLDLAKALDERGKAIAVFNLADLPKAIEKAKKFSAEKKSEREQLVSRLAQFIEGEN